MVIIAKFAKIKEKFTLDIFAMFNESVTVQSLHFIASVPKWEKGAIKLRPASLFIAKISKLVRRLLGVLTPTVLASFGDNDSGKLRRDFDTVAYPVGEYTRWLNAGRS
jgi:hypothetical protein